MIPYQELLNASQYKVVSAGTGPMLVVAGAGTGKTRTIVYRLAWLVEHGVPPWNILLLTFTRKAAKEMLDRAQVLLGGGEGEMDGMPGDLHGLTGGTFHSFAYRILREYKPEWLGGHSFTVLDAADQQDMLKGIKEEKGIGKGVKGFPKIQAVLGFISKAKNKEAVIQDILKREAVHLLNFADDFRTLQEEYAEAKRAAFVLDYDDLLFELEALLRTDPDVRAKLQDHYQHILVDEYQDTNLVQARLVKLLAGDMHADRSVMAVGDEAQSIYSFRGATVRNILEFSQLFPGAKIIPLEKNYRSVQSVLDVANAVMSQSQESYAKHLEAQRTEDVPVHMVKCSSDGDQGTCVAGYIASQIRDKGRKPSEFAVLFRVGYQSFQTEAALTSLGIPFRKYGGLRYQEAAHVKDFMAYLNFIVNPDNEIAFTRLAGMQPRVGAKTAAKMFAALAEEESREKMAAKYPAFFEEIGQLETLREGQDNMKVRDIMDAVMDLYQPHFEELYPEDYPMREHGLDELRVMAQDADMLDLFLAEMQLDSVDKKEEDGECVTLSTIHSAKGLEWNTVIVLDLVSGRFPSHFAENRQESMEEERRLMYVACTRAKDELFLFYYDSCRQYGGWDACDPSIFLDDVQFVPALRRCAGSSRGRLVCRGGSAEKAAGSAAQDVQKKQSVQAGGDSAAKASSETSAEAPVQEQPYVHASSCLGEIAEGKHRACRHRIFGEGRILGFVEPDKIVVDFPGFGRKTIAASYLFVQKLA